MKTAVLAVVFLLAASLGFPVWNATLSISAADMNGVPLEGARVAVAYQELSALSEDDGQASGTTDENGLFSILLENRVPQQSESHKAKVTLSTSYWEGETRTYLLNGTGPMNFSFIVPVELEQIYIEVLTSRQALVQGASVAVSSGDVIRKTTGARGEVALFLPKGSSFSGTATYGNLTKAFTSSEIDESGGAKTLSVVLPEAAEQQPETPAPALAGGFELKILLPNGSAAASHPLNATYAGIKHAAYTDSSGMASFQLNGSNLLQVEIAENEYVYRYDIDASKKDAATIALEPLLQVNSFTSAPDGEGCYRIIASISDPRTSLPLDVRMERFGESANFTLPVAGEAGGIFSSRLCIKTETKVVVRATNKYESAGAVLVLLPQAGAVGPVAPVVPIIAKPDAASPEKKPYPAETLLLPALVIGLLAGLVLLFVFARRYLYRIPRFIAEYLHKTMREMQKGRKPPMPGIPPADEIFKE